MTGIVIFTAGREDAYDDYKRSVRDGVNKEEISEFVSEHERQGLDEVYENDKVRVWGTQVDTQWQKVQPGDIALVYRDGSLIAQARVVQTIENLELAEHLWKIEENPWDEENPWKYLVFVNEFEEINVGLTAFNELVGYDSDYVPQGFSRVADKRIGDLETAFDSVENAVAELTGVGERVHPVKEDEDDDRAIDELGDELLAASRDGNRGEEFEQLVAEAFTSLGCTARWIEGGNDTDVEITAPVHAIVEAKSRSGGHGVVDPKASRVATHRDSRGADYALIVGPRFPPASITDAERNEITTLSVDTLVELLDRREKYGVPPERLFEQLRKPGAFQDDRLDLIDEHLQERLDAFDGILQVIKSLERSNDPVDANEIRWILTGMTEGEEIPSSDEIGRTLHFLSHPCVQLLDDTEGGYELLTTYDNALEILSSIGTLASEAIETESNDLTHSSQ